MSPTRIRPAAACVLPAVVAGLTGLAGLAGCDTPASPGTGPAPGPTSRAPLSPGPDVPRLPAGLVWFDPDTAVVSVYDPADGHTVYEAQVAGAGDIVRLEYSTDGLSAAGTDHCNLLMFRWTGHAFAKVADHAEPVDECYGSPRFREGRFWTDDGTQQVSIDPAAPQTLRPEGPRDPMVTGKATLADRDGEIEMTASRSQVGTIVIALRDAAGPYYYQCPFPVDATTSLCGGGMIDGSLTGAPWGSVAVATADLGTRVVTMRQVLPAAKMSIYTMVMSPDRTEILIQTGDGWIRVDRAGKHPPRPVARRLPPEHPSLTWL
ncbi:hypothetical protein KZZ52_24045 [Dactylosporangium sp. AC04546]|uniref:hypothetical protein n=1 Tax=Dactylosporangium sp. AC04546 TaxID=2862460 RepID=UPI001EDED45D|nr:hypothetical protein [Dactylosporangium sp. AC04546]WVK88348.1 hypothetical protein KZZ52_24045 [Dactylosporangium sp. AC04546]